jgi:hypothetical protein
MRQGPIRQSCASTGSPIERREHRLPGPVPFGKASRAALAAGLFGSLALLPLAWAQGSLTRQRVPRLPPAQPPHHGLVLGVGKPIRVLAIGESTVSGVGLSRGDESASRAATRQSPQRRRGRWRV